VAWISRQKRRPAVLRPFGAFGMSGLSSFRSQKSPFRGLVIVSFWLVAGCWPALGAVVKPSGLCDACNLLNALRPGQEAAGEGIPPGRAQRSSARHNPAARRGKGSGVLSAQHTKR
jgi:hypothetical protein